MSTPLADIIGKNDKKYTKILRLLHLIEGVNKSIENSKAMNSKLMKKQFLSLKKDYTKELLEQLAEYQLPLSINAAA